MNFTIFYFVSVVMDGIHNLLYKLARNKFNDFSRYFGLYNPNYIHPYLSTYSRERALKH